MKDVILSPISKDELIKDFTIAVRKVLENPTSHPKEQDRYLTENEVSKTFGISKPTLKKLRDTGELPFHRIGASVRYLQSEIQEAISSRKYQRKGGFQS